MKIIPISFYNINSNRKINYNQLSFAGDFIEDTFEKYKYVNDYSGPVWDAIENHYFFWQSQAQSEAYFKITEQIRAFQALKEQKKEKIKEFDKDIIQANKKIEEELNANNKISTQILDCNVKSELEAANLQNTIVSEQRISKINQELNKTYIQLNDTETKIYPNGIMIIGTNENENNATINHLLNNNLKLYVTDFNDYPIENANKQLFTIKKDIAKNKKHATIVIKNFAKYTVPSEMNNNFINKLKSFLSDGQKSNYTVLVFVNNPEKLDTIVTQGHRFDIKIEVNDIKSPNKTELFPIEGGYNLKYGENASECVKIYLGSKGQDKRTLWIASQNPIEIVKVLQRIAEIKKIKEFRKIKYIQVLQPTSLNELKDFELVRRNSDGVGIYEMKV